MKNGKPLDQNPKIRIINREGWGIITISKATESDSGLYKCVLVNSFNAIETEANVTVYDVGEIEVKPTFTRISGNYFQSRVAFQSLIDFLVDYYRQEVDDYVIEIQVRGVPTPKLTWTRDGATLDVTNSDKLIVMREPEGVYKLCIHDPQKIDSGRFIIEAENKAGKEEIRRVVRFLGKEHYKYLPGIRHADPKKPHDDDGENVPVEEVVEPEPEDEEPLMVNID